MNYIQELLPEILLGFEHAMDDALVEAKRLSSGDLSSRDLAALDHPYAKRHGHPLLGLLPVNVQTGDFRSAWTRTPTTFTPDEVSGQIRNDDPKADLIQKGTKITFGRGIKEAETDYVRTEVERRINQRLHALALNATAF